MISMIAIHKTPHSGIGKFITLVGYSSVLPNIIWSQAIYIWVTISLTTISRPPIGICLSLVALRCGLSKIYRPWIYLSAAENCVQKYHKGVNSKYVGKKISWWFQTIHYKNNVLAVDKSTIVENEPT